jgi:hypothetical protein
MCCNRGAVRPGSDRRNVGGATGIRRRGTDAALLPGPDGKPDYSPAPKKTPDGRDYKPVYDETTAPAETQTAARAAK